jgi:hypothetical protein
MLFLGYRHAWHGFLSTPLGAGKSIFDTEKKGASVLFQCPGSHFPDLVGRKKHGQKKARTKRAI